LTLVTCISVWVIYLKWGEGFHLFLPLIVHFLLLEAMALARRKWIERWHRIYHGGKLK